MDLLTKLGIDWRLLLAQLLNFTVLMLVLNYLLYQPIIKILRDREKMIKRSLKDSQRIEEELLKIAKERDEKIKAANREATQIIKKSQESGESKKSQIIMIAEKEAQGIIEKAKVETEKLTLKAKENIVEELTDIIISITEKLISEKLDSQADKKLIKQAINNAISQT